ncbi:hypothetical protein ACU4GD_28085 [Cupriavidus basilensis]
MEIWYEPHPVSPQRKAELRAMGLQIVDAIFKPEDYENPPLLNAEGLRMDGPTIAEFVAAGCPAAEYPPHGYAPRSTAEEIASAVAAVADTNGDGKLSIGEIRDALTAKGIEFDPKAKRADLQALLDAATMPAEV